MMIDSLHIILSFAHVCNKCIKVLVHWRVVQVRVAGHCFTAAGTTRTFTNGNIRSKKNKV